MWNAAEPIALSTAQRSDIEALVRSGRTPQRVVTRARIVLASADGTSINAIASDLSVSRPTVYLWRQRFEQAGIAGLLKDAARPGRRKAVSPEKVQAIVDATLHTDAAGCDALECADDGQGAGRQPRHRASHLAGARVAAASRRNVQAQSRPGLREEAAGRGRHVLASARESAGLLCRRKAAGPGTRPDRAGLAAAAGDSRASNPTTTSATGRPTCSRR